LDFTINGKHAAFLLGRKLGYYRDAGIELTVLEGKGSLTTVQSVQAKSDTFGFADAGALLTVVASGGKTRMVACFQQLNPLSVISFQPIKAPQDVLGKTIGLNPAGNSPVGWAAFVAVNKLDQSRIKVVSLDGPALLPALIAGTIDAQIGNSNSEGAAAPLLTDKPLYILRFADFHTDQLAHGLVVNQETIDKDPDLVRRFVAASVRSWTYAIAHPDEAVNALIEAFPDAKRDIITNQLRLSLDLLHTANTKDKPLGWMAESDWKSSLDLLTKYGPLKTTLPPSAFYTNDFLP
jgi:NitT/TauT family transport system substrate-binding protein